MFTDLSLHFWKWTNCQTLAISNVSAVYSKCLFTFKSSRFSNSSSDRRLPFL